MPPRITGSTRASAAAAVVLSLGVLLTGCVAATTPPPTPSASASGSSLAKSIETLIKAGIAQGDAGNQAGATSTFQNVLQLDPGNKFAYFNLGVLAQGAGQTADAIANYDAALKTDPAFTSAMYNKAILLESTSADQAIALYKQIVGINPQAATAYMRLSFVLEAQGDKTGAKAARSSAIALDPSLATASATPAP